MSVRNLYRDMIIAHSKSPKNFKVIENPTHCSHGKNPLCGDDFLLYVTIESDVIQDIGFMGQGCAISKASASMMTAALKGKTVSDALNVKNVFLTMLLDALDPAQQGVLGKLTVFEGVKEYPVRVKCATLIWRAIEAALQSTGTNGPIDVSTE